VGEHPEYGGIAHAALDDDLRYPARQLEERSQVAELRLN
jgi:hypothetical protein